MAANDAGERGGGVADRGLVQSTVADHEAAEVSALDTEGRERRHADADSFGAA